MGIQKMQVKEKVDEASAPKVPKTGQIQIQKPDPAAIEAPAAPSIPAPKVDEAAKKKDEGADADQQYYLDVNDLHVLFFTTSQSQVLIFKSMKNWADTDTTSESDQR